MFFQDIKEEGDVWRFQYVAKLRSIVEGEDRVERKCAVRAVFFYKRDDLRERGVIEVEDIASHAGSFQGGGELSGEVSYCIIVAVSMKKDHMFYHKIFSVRFMADRIAWSML